MGDREFLILSPQQAIRAALEWAAEIPTAAPEVPGLPAIADQEETLDVPLVTAIVLSPDGIFAAAADEASRSAWTFQMRGNHG